MAVRVRARGGEGAKPGDTVIIESAARRILGLAALVYLLPLVLFFAGYAVSALTGGLGFALGIGLLVPANRFAEKKELYRVIP
ncbi:MAG: SoxR reducing system RseC family protein [Oscillospiraceae bacterium]|nr:SoxR reducing system RseC family protein [Oscillospiraceae bacterium]